MVEMTIEEQLRAYALHHGKGVSDWVFEPENQRLVAPDKLYYTSTDDGRIQTLEYHPEEGFAWNRVLRHYKLAKDRVTFETVRYWHYEDVLAALTRDEIPQELWDEYHAIHAYEMVIYHNSYSFDSMTSFLHEGRISQSCFDAFSWLFNHSAVRFSDQHQRGDKPDALAIPFAFDYPMCEIERFIYELG